MFRHQRPLIHKSSQHINVSSINKRSPIPDNVTELTFLLSRRRFDDMVTQEKTLFLSARRVHATGENPAVVALYSCSSRDLILMWMPLMERRISRGSNLGFKAGSSISWYLLSVRAVTTLSSFMAKV